MKINIFIILIATIFFSCSKKGEEDHNIKSAYLNAFKLLQDKNYSESIEQFEKIDDDFPFSKWAIKAHAMSVYACYKDENYDKLIQIVDSFISLNPSSDYVSYMLYMKGLSYYNQIPNITVGQDNTEFASFSFRELLARFPQSKFEKDVKEKLEFVDNHISGARMEKGRYYMSKKNYIGALQVFNDVITRYRNTKHVPEAYFRIMEIYLKIGMKEEAESAKIKLQSKFPDSEWVMMLE